MKNIKPGYYLLALVLLIVLLVVFLPRGNKTTTCVPIEENMTVKTANKIIEACNEAIDANKAQWQLLEDEQQALSKKNDELRAIVASSPFTSALEKKQEQGTLQSNNLSLLR